MRKIHYAGFVLIGLTIGAFAGAATAQAEGSNATGGSYQSTVSKPDAAKITFDKFQAIGGGSASFFADEDCDTAESITVLVCPSGHTCHCVHVEGPISAPGISDAVFTLDADFDLTSSENTETFTNGVSSGLCLPGGGFGSISGKNGKVNLSFIGMECDNTSLGLGDFLTGLGTVLFQGGTGSFTDATGASNLSFQGSFGSDQPATYSIQGELGK